MKISIKDFAINMSRGARCARGRLEQVRETAIPGSCA